MSSKHTPGTWEVSKLGNGLHILGDRRPGSAQVVATVGGSSQVNLEANARLIAKAPEMRELLTDLGVWLVSPQVDIDTLAEQRARIRALLSEVDGNG